MRRNRIVVSLMIILSTLLVSNYGGRIAYSLFYFSVGIPIASLLYSVYVYARFKLYQSTESKTIVKGTTTEYRFQLANEDIITYVSLRVNFYHDKSRVLELDEAKEYCLLPEQKIDRNTRMICEYRGEYTIGVESVTITDFLYLFQIRYRIREKLVMQVLPRMVEIDSFPLMFPDLNNRVHFYGKKGEEEPDHELRNYEAGDSIRKIHWRATAKRNALMTKKYIKIPEPRVHIFADYSFVSGDEFTRTVIEDKILEALIAVVRFYFEKKITCNVYYRQARVILLSVTDANQFQQFYHHCIKVRFNEETPIEDIVEGEKGLYFDQDSFLVITHKLTQKLYQTLAGLTGMGLNGAVILITDVMAEETTAMAKLMEESCIRVLQIAGNQEIEDRLTAIR